MNADPRRHRPTDDPVPEAIVFHKVWPRPKEPTLLNMIVVEKVE